MCGQDHLHRQGYRALPVCYVSVHLCVQVPEPLCSWSGADQGGDPLVQQLQQLGQRT